LFNGDRVAVLQVRKQSADGLHNHVNVLDTAELALKVATMADFAACFVPQARQIKNKLLRCNTYCTGNNKKVQQCIFGEQNKEWETVTHKIMGAVLAEGSLAAAVEVSYLPGILADMGQGMWSRMSLVALLLQ
jgi:hypothetical protein